MIKVKCVDKFRDGQGKICGYRLMDCYGKTQDMFAETLKEEIKNNNISVINLTLTSDGRLVDSSEKPVKNEETKKTNLGSATNAYRNFNSLVDTLVGPYNYHPIVNRRIEVDDHANPTLIAKAINVGNRPIIVMAMDGNYITDENNTVRIDGDIGLMKRYLMSEMNAFTPSKKASLKELTKYVCKFAEKNNLGIVQYHRYDKSEDEDGFAVFIADYTSDENYRYKVKMDIAESGVLMTMDIKDTKLINYNSINCDLDKTNVEYLMNYLVYIIQNKIASSNSLSICNGEIWNVL